MEKETLSVSFPSVKLDALRFYLSEKGLTVEGELQEHMAQVYEKQVPSATRRYLDRNDVPAQQAAVSPTEHEQDETPANPRRGKIRPEKAQKAELKVIAPESVAEPVVEAEPEYSGPVMSM